MTRIRTLRKDRDYPMLNAAIKSLKYKELLNYVMTFGKLQIVHRLFMPKENFDAFMKTLKLKLMNLKLKERLTTKSLETEWVMQLKC